MPGQTVDLIRVAKRVATRTAWNTGTPPVVRNPIEHALAATGYDVSEAARQLGVTRIAMRYRMRKDGLDKSPEDSGAGL
ncbi:MAG: helix-turn-helix domain-containing protein [Gammaproteobacteria bacterium]|nr:helix-turn-helix domain-containing protein [Gammaproteobacteria bacterium]